VYGSVYAADDLLSQDGITGDNAEKLHKWLVEAEYATDQIAVMADCINRHVKTPGAKKVYNLMMSIIG